MPAVAGSGRAPDDGGILGLSISCVPVFVNLLHVPTLGPAHCPARLSAPRKDDGGHPFQRLTQVCLLDDEARAMDRTQTVRSGAAGREKIQAMRAMMSATGHGVQNCGMVANVMDASGEKASGLRHYGCEEAGRQRRWRRAGQFGSAAKGSGVCVDDRLDFVPPVDHLPHEEPSINQVEGGARTHPTFERARKREERVRSMPVRWRPDARRSTRPRLRGPCDFEGEKAPHRVDLPTLVK